MWNWDPDTIIIRDLFSIKHVSVVSWMWKPLYGPSPGLWNLWEPSFNLPLVTEHGQTAGWRCPHRGGGGRWHQLLLLHWWPLASNLTAAYSVSIPNFDIIENVENFSTFTILYLFNLHSAGDSYYSRQAFYNLHPGDGLYLELGRGSWGVGSAGDGRYKNSGC